MKVAFIAISFGQLYFELAGKLAKQADIAYVVDQFDIDTYGQEINPDLNLITFNRARLRQFLIQIRTCLRLIKLIHKYKPDIIHYQHGHFWFNIFLPLLAKYPLVVTVHDPNIM
jgi:glycosyltransferase involved in cell wall biosynthesis